MPLVGGVVCAMVLVVARVRALVPSTAPRLLASPSLARRTRPPLLLSTTATTTTPTTSPRGLPRETSTTRSSSSTTSARVRAFAEEAFRVARETGPRAAAARTIEAQRAVLSTLLELRDELPRPPDPELALRMASELFASSSSSSSPTTSALPLQSKLLTEWLRENAKPELVARFARKLFERLGATYVKIGQFIASSPTLFPPAYVKEFEKCLDQTMPVPFEDIKKIVERDLGRPLTSVYDSFETKPLASASVAQVHAAVYKGKDVVVKVRKPKVADLLKADLGFVEVAGKFLELLAPDLGRISLADVLSDLRVTMLDELDFNKELKNLETFGSWLDSSQLRDVATCPEPVREASGARTLTMTRLKGVPLTDLSSSSPSPSSSSSNVDGSSSSSSERVLVNALNVWTASVLTCEFFHADVHAGNLLALPDGRVGFLDFGIVGRVPGEIWDGIAAAAAAFSVRDANALAKALKDIGAADKDVDIDRFGKDLNGVFAALDALEPTLVLDVDQQQTSMTTSATVALDDQQVTDVLINLVQAAERNGVKLPREFGLLVKQALYFDRFVKLLAPEMDVLNDDRLEYLKDATDRESSTRNNDDSPRRRLSQSR